MPGLHELVLGILLPALLCGVLLALGRWQRRDPSAQSLAKGMDGVRGALSGLAFGLPWILSFFAFFRRLPTWPTESTTPSASDWLAWIVLLAALSSLLYLTSLSPAFLSGLVRLLFSVGLVLLTLGRWAERTGSWTTVAVAIPLLVAVWSAADAWIGRGDGLRGPLALAVAATSASLANLLARNALLGALAGAVAACLVAAFALARFRPAFRLHPGASAVIVLVLAGTTIQGHVFGKLPLASALLVAASLVAPALAGRWPASAGSRWKGACIASAIALLPGAIAVWIAWSPGDDSYGSY